CRCLLPIEEIVRDGIKLAECGDSRQPLSWVLSSCDIAWVGALGHLSWTSDSVYSPAALQNRPLIFRKWPDNFFRILRNRRTLSPHDTLTKRFSNTHKMFLFGISITGKRAAPSMKKSVFVICSSLICAASSLQA